MIYLIQSQGDGRIKIGQSENPARRLRQLRTGSSSAEPYIILAVLPGGRRREGDLKNTFEEFRSHGEWFNPAPKVLELIRRETYERDTLKHCRVCGMLHLATPEDDDIKQHSQLHKMIRQGAYPYSIREFMKDMAWAMLGSDGASVKISTRQNKEEMKRVIVFAWWAREREHGLPDADFEDYVLDYMDYLDARSSGNKEELTAMEKTLKKHWGKV